MFAHSSRRLFVIYAGRFYGLLLCAFCACNDSQSTKVVYDEASLKQFVLATKNEKDATNSHQLDSIMQAASTDSLLFRQTIAFLEPPFSSPNSSYRNQSLYTKLLTAKIQSAWFSSDEKYVAERRIKLLQQNNAGQAANDFSYITPAGYHRKMSGVKSKYVLLYFNNPGCEACVAMKTALMNSPTIQDKTASGELKILSIYPDKDEQFWLEHLKEYPDSWIQGRDDSAYLNQNIIYDLRAIPTLYLLDSNKRVMLKDCMDVGAIEAAISR